MVAVHTTQITKQRPIVLLFNPTTGHADSIADLLRMEGITIGAQVEVSELDARHPRGNSWRRSGYGVVVAAGGDGTVGTAASQIAGSNLPLGILPLGTSNDIARALGIPLDLAAACAVIADGIATVVDAGVITPIPAATSSGYERDVRATLRRMARRLLPSGALRLAVTGRETRFMHAAAMGLNVEFARLATDVARRRRWGPLNYATASVEALTKLQPVPVSLRLSGVRMIEGDPERTSRSRQEDTFTVTCQAIQVAIVNTPVFGGALNMRLPAARLDDRLLDVIIIEALEPRMLRDTVERLLAALGALAASYISPPQSPRPSAQSAENPTGEANETSTVAEDALLMTEGAARFSLPGVRHYQARSMRIDAPAGIEITADGEIVGHTPAEVYLAEQSMSVLLPRAAQQ